MSLFRPKRGGQSAVRPDMNVTPLVDVVLVLLIIFMVIAPELEHGTRVELPNVNNPDTNSRPDEKQVTLTVAADGSMFLEDEPVSRAALAGRLKTVHEGDRSKRLWLKGDAGRPYGELRGIFREVQKAGFPGVKLMVGAREPDTAEPEGQ
ncbi:MAG: biopolymer transporter ExbD [Deltaproteobacteria bacterium HGW-Deltaproteobacteria-14]|nr:MAG: biopolymer transporter ExbD [Deltaproteobacteria bacterium HGW-Deltaproteobacteria-14]